MTSSSSDKRDLIDLALDNKPVPRVPVGFWFHFLADIETADASKDDAAFKANIEGHRRFVEAFGPDMVKIMSDGFFLHPASGPFSSPAEALERVEALGPGHPWIDRQVELVRQVADLSPGVRRFYNVFSPSTTLRFMIGRERLVAWLRDEPIPTQELLGRMARTLAALAGAAVGDGLADGIYLSVQNPDSEAISDSAYASLFKASELSILKASRAAGGRDILHVCGYAGIKNRLPSFADYPAAMLSWAAAVEGVPLGRGREIFGGRAVVGGFPNVPGSLIHAGTEA